QLETEIFCGDTKSLISALKEADERLFRYAEPKLSHVDGLGPKMLGRAWLRLTPISPKVLPASETFAIGSLTVEALICPSAKPPRSIRSPQHGKLFDERHTFLAIPATTGTEALVNHVSRPSVGFEPPFVKSYVNRRSPGLRVIATPPEDGNVVGVWFSSKSMFAEPRTFVRSQAR